MTTYRVDPRSGRYEPVRDIPTGPRSRQDGPRHYEPRQRPRRLSWWQRKRRKWAKAERTRQELAYAAPLAWRVVRLATWLLWSASCVLLGMRL